MTNVILKAVTLLTLWADMQEVDMQEIALWWCSDRVSSTSDGLSGGSDGKRLVGRLWCRSFSVLLHLTALLTNPLMNQSVYRSIRNNVTWVWATCDSFFAEDCSLVLSANISSQCVKSATYQSIHHCHFARLTCMPSPLCLPKACLELFHYFSEVVSKGVDACLPSNHCIRSACAWL